MIKSTKKKKPIRMGSLASKLASDKYMGPEPIVKHGYSQSEMIFALNWYNYMYELNDGIDWVMVYMKANPIYTKQQVNDIRRVDFKKIGMTTMSMCRIVNNGTEIEQRSLDRIHEKLISSLAARVKVPEATTTKSVVSVQDRIREKTDNAIAELEAEVDTFTTNDYNSEFDPFSFMKTHDLKAAQTNKIISYYKPVIDELVYAKKEKEGYAHINRAQQTRFIEFLTKIIKAAESMSYVIKATRTPRKPKAKSSVQVVSKLSYAKENAEYKIASIDPAQIVGAKQLWTFNPKYNLFTAYISEGGLSVKGTTILGYDETLSIRKRYRKPEELCPSILKATKPQLKKIVKDLNMSKAAEVQLSGRITSDVILLRVEK